MCKRKSGNGIQTHCTGSIHSNDEFNSVVRMLLPDSGYVLCPGLCASDYEDKQSVIRFQSSEVHIIREPIVRYESNQCILWHNPSNRQLNLLHKLHVCNECKKVSSPFLFHY